MIVNHANLANFFTGLSTQFRLGYSEAPTQWQELATTIPSNTESLQMAWLGLSPQVRRWLGDRVIQSIGSHKYSIENLSWELTLAAERDKLEDDLHGIYSPIAQRMGEVAKQHMDRLVFTLINEGDSATYTDDETGEVYDIRGYDGQPMFSASHPGPDGVQSNMSSSGSSTPWYLASITSRVFRPVFVSDREAGKFVSKQSLTDDEVFHRKRFLFGWDARYNAKFGAWQQMYRSTEELDAEHLEEAITAMRGIRNENGTPSNWKATHIIVPPSMEFTAERLFSQAVLSGGESNIHLGRLKVIVSPWLDDA